MAPFFRAVTFATCRITKRRPVGRDVISRATAGGSGHSCVGWQNGVKPLPRFPDNWKGQCQRVWLYVSLAAARIGVRPPVSHSHLALQHLIHKIDSAEPRQKRSTAPAWLPEFVDRVADLFEPFIDVGRVGYECTPSAEHWEISMYLGATESVGGQVDGEVRSVAFQFDLARLHAVFDSVDEFRWSAFPTGTIPTGAIPTSAIPTDTAGQDEQTEGGQRSFVAIVGRYGDNLLRLRVFCTPPAEVSPGLRQFADGTWEAV